jgi:hypothetical protein
VCRHIAGGREALRGRVYEKMIVWLLFFVRFSLSGQSQVVNLVGCCHIILLLLQFGTCRVMFATDSLYKSGSVDDSTCQNEANGQGYFSGMTFIALVSTDSLDAVQHAGDGSRCVKTVNAMVATSE